MRRLLLLLLRVRLQPDSGSHKVTSMTHSRIPALALSVALALFAFAVAAESPPASEPGVVVEVAKASMARVAPRRWVPGGVVSRNDARLATSAEGRLEYVAEVGTRVRAGERVAKLEDEAVRLRVDDAKAEVARIDSQRAMS